MNDNIITSTQNEIFKHISKLYLAKHRKVMGEFVLEGERLVNDAHKNNADINFLVVCESYNGKFPEGVKTYTFSNKLFNELKDTVNSQGILAVAKMNKKESFDFESARTIVYLDLVCDPGNMGTIIRTCDAAGVDAVVLSKGCVDIYNPKVVRSTMSSLFNVNIINDDNTLLKLKDMNFSLIGTYLGAKKSVYDIDFSKKSVIIIGNEANGISDEVITLCDEKIIIPMVGKCESLNAAISCGICVYEALRQKLNK
ncbi:MAG: RNA methyltransferase [Ruminococcaceae bacterium]|nr:RNA methyltransferase [Oscillospiraceae bacterium]